MANAAFLHEKSGNIITPRGRMLWPSLFKPQTFQGEASDNDKYAITLLIPATADITVMKEAAKAAALKKFSDPASVTLRNPFIRTEDQPKLAHLAEQFPIMIRARSAEKPGVRGPSREVVDDPSLVYGGRWCICSVQAFGYDTKGNKGVSWGLQNVQLLDHDEPLAGARVRPEVEFERVEISGPKEGAVGENNGAASTDALF